MVAGNAPDDPAARRSDRAFFWFGWYLRWYFWRRFHAVRVSLTGLPAVPPERPVVVYSNHCSWWDPAFFILLSTLLFPGRRGFGPMDAESLGRYGVLQRMGVFGIDVSSPRGAARFLRTGRRLLAEPGHMLWVTAEGTFVDNRQRPVVLRPGLAHLLRHVPGAVVLPLALEYTFWNEGRPEALARFGPAVDTAGAGTTAALTALLEADLTRTMDTLAAESARRDPALFRTLLSGHAGVGGIYDLYRRSRAMLGGRRFDPSHGGRA